MRYTKFAVALLAASLTLLGGCASTILINNWDDPAYTEKMKKVLVIGMSKNETTRANFEYSLTAALKTSGVDATPSATIMPVQEEPTRDSVKAVIEGKGYDTVLVTRLVSVTTEERYVPGGAYVPPSPYYYGFYDYYAYTYPNVYSTGYLVNDTVVKLETNVYETAAGKLVWAVQSQTFNPINLSEEFGALTEIIIKQLKKDGMI